MRNDITITIAGNGTKVVKTFPEMTTWDDLIEGFIDALRALGFKFVADTNDIVQAIVGVNERSENE